MRFRMSFAGSAVCLIGLAFPASSQTSPGGNTTSQVSKTWEIGRSVADQLDPFVRDVEHKHHLADYLGDYVQRLEDRIATRAGVKPEEIRVTEGSEWYAFLLPQGVLYISAGLLERVSSEGELAGLLAHELAHENPKLAGGRFQQCALAAGYLPVQRSPRESERLATQRAIGYMKASGYDPSAMLDLFSQVSYENQKWSKAIASEDLLRLRVALEAEAEPVDGYVIDDSEFAKFRARLPGVKPIPLIILRPRQ
jgi:predicted Zn-dependent protease